MSEPLVSAIVPAYNEEDRVSSAIESIGEQTYENIETVVVNDGSTDRTGEVVRENFPEVTLVEQENTGLPGARNAGARAASGEFLTFLDADDRWAPNKVERQLEIFDARPEIDVLGTNSMVHTAEHTFYFNNPRGPLVREFSIKDILVHRRRPPGASIMIRTRAFEHVGGYDGSLSAFDDGDLLTRLIAMGHPLASLNEPLYIIYRADDRMGQRSFSVRAKGNLQVLEKWDPRRDDMPFETPFTPREYARLIGQNVMIAAFRCFAEGDRELGREYLQRLDDLPEMPGGLRFLRRLAETSWPLFGVTCGCYQWGIHSSRVLRDWGGVTGVIRQSWDRYVRPGEQTAAFESQEMAESG